MDNSSFKSKAHADGIERFCVGVALFSESKLLLVKRSADDFLGGYWELPGGGVEADESFVLCLTREIQEELGLEENDYKIEKEIASFDYLSDSGKKVRQWNVRATLLADKSKVKLNPLEHEELTWVDPKNVQDLKLTDEILGVIRSTF